MESLTKRRLPEAEVAALVRHAVGVPATAVTEMTEGYYAAAYAVSLADGREVVLKLAPPPDLPLLTYEVDLVHAEALYYRAAAAAGVPVPRVYAVDLTGELCSSHYTVVSRLPGTPLHHVAASLDADTDRRLRHAVGAHTARLHRSGGPFFGYPRRDGRTRSASWRVSFMSMVDDLIADAVRLDVDLGAPAATVGRALHRNAGLLDEVRQPALVHFDLWDGNMFVDAAGELTGIIDGERAFYGDPCAEFVSMALFRDVDEVPDLLAGYATAAGAPLRLDAADRTRLDMYTAYLYLILITEGPTRGYGGPEHKSMVADVMARLDRILVGLTGRRPGPPAG